MLSKIANPIPSNIVAVVTVLLIAFPRFYTESSRSDVFCAKTLQ